MKLASCKSALNPPVVCSINSSKAVVPVLVLLFVALCLWLGPPWFNYWFSFTPGHTVELAMSTRLCLL